MLLKKCSTFLRPLIKSTRPLLLSLILGLFGVLPLYSYAFLCPTNFNQIYPGYSMTQVKQLCGPPTSQSSQPMKQKLPQEWTYYTTLSVVGLGLTNTNSSGTVKITMAFDSDEKLIHLTLNGTSLTSTDACQQTVQIGDTISKVRDACGQPNYVNKSQDTTNAPPATVTKWHYNSTPPATLIFIDQKLQNI